MYRAAHLINTLMLLLQFVVNLIRVGVLALALATGIVGVEEVLALVILSECPGAEESGHTNDHADRNEANGVLARLNAKLLAGSLGGESWGHSKDCRCSSSSLGHGALSKLLGGDRHLWLGSPHGGAADLGSRCERIS